MVDSEYYLMAIDSLDRVLSGHFMQYTMRTRLGDFSPKAFRASEGRTARMYAVLVFQGKVHLTKHAKRERANHWSTVCEDTERSCQWIPRAHHQNGEIKDIAMRDESSPKTPCTSTIGEDLPRRFPSLMPPRISTASSVSCCCTCACSSSSPSLSFPPFDATGRNQRAHLQRTRL